MREIVVHVRDISQSCRIYGHICGQINHEGGLAAQEEKS